MFRRRPKQDLARHQRVLLAYANALTGDRELAHDLTQECAVRALRADRIPAEERAYQAWLFRILRNLWLDHLRKNGRRNQVFVEEGGASVRQVLETEKLVVNAVAVRMAFERLSDDHRDVLSLVDIGGFSYQETSDLLGIAVGTVMSRVNRARCALARLLEPNNVVELPVRRKRRLP